MTNRSVRQIEHDAARAGFHQGVRGVSGKVSWHIKCWYCGDVASKSWAPLTSAQMMIRAMHAQGWEVGQNTKPRCPGCCARKKEKPRLVTNVTVPADPVMRPKLVIPEQAPPVSQPTQPSPKIARAVFGLLEDHFDDKTLRYLHRGWDDEAIAKQAGTTAEVVCRLREGAFGKLAEDPRIESLRADIALCVVELADFEKEMQRKLDDLTRRVAEVQA